MSKSSQRKRSMYQLGYQEGAHYLPRYPESKEYMRGYNKKEKKHLAKSSTSSRVISFLVILSVTVFLGVLLT